MPQQFIRSSVLYSRILYIVRFSRLFQNRPDNHTTEADTVVVIDVLRSFTTAAVALARGAVAVYPVAAPGVLDTISSTVDRIVSVGAAAGGAPVPGFDYGNSPSALSNADLAGRNVVISTAAGVRGLHLFRQAKHLFAASLVCASATVRAIKEAGCSEVCFVITGEWDDRDGDEDIACADYMEALLRGETVAPQAFAQRVRGSDFGARFATGIWANLPTADLDIASHVDLFEFAMPVRRQADLLVIHSASHNGHRARP
jgi:2-phosphosulfolactate phosphatase